MFFYLYYYLLAIICIIANKYSSCSNNLIENGLSVEMFIIKSMSFTKILERLVLPISHAKQGYVHVQASYLIK